MMELYAITTGLFGYLFSNILMRDREALCWYPPLIRYITTGTTKMIATTAWREAAQKFLGLCGKCVAFWTSLALQIFYFNSEPIVFAYYAIIAVFTAVFVEEKLMR